MTDRTVVDGSLFFRARRRSAIQRRSPEPRVLRVLYLDGVGVCELMHALHHSGLAITTDSEGRNVLHHKPPTPEAA